MYRIWIIMLVGCWTSNAAIVRMARSDEHALPPDTEDNPLPKSCPTSGPLASELFEPVVAFARANLVSGLDRYAITPPDQIHSVLVLPDQPEPPARPGILVAVQPRAAVGQLDVASWTNKDDGTNERYCLYVEHTGSRITIVVKEWSLVIYHTMTTARSARGHRRVL